MRTGLTIAAALTLVPTAALAHPGIGEMHGFVHGFTHPLGGLDHILAMVTVGIFVAARRPRAGAATFVLAMAIGGARSPRPACRADRRNRHRRLGDRARRHRRPRHQAPLAIAMGLVSLFAIFHGHARLRNAARSRTGIYAAGFMPTTALLRDRHRDQRRPSRIGAYGLALPARQRTGGARRRRDPHDHDQQAYAGHARRTD